MRSGPLVFSVSCFHYSSRLRIQRTPDLKKRHIWKFKTAAREILMAVIRYGAAAAGVEHAVQGSAIVKVAWILKMLELLRL